MHLYGTSGVNERGHLKIGGVDTIELIEQFGTPLYVYDVELIRERARGFKRTFEELGISAQVAYASKAFSSIAMIQLADQEGLSLDVVSAGNCIRQLRQISQLNAFTFMEITKVKKSCIWLWIMKLAV